MSVVAVLRRLGRRGAVLALLAVLCLGGCASMVGYYEKPKLSLVGISLDELGLFEQRFTVKLRIQNGNDIALPIKGVRVKISLKGQAFADGVSNEPLTVPKFGEAVLSLKVSAKLTGVLKQLPTWLASGEIPYRIEGVVSTSSLLGSFTFDHEDRFSLSEPSPKPDNSAKLNWLQVVRQWV